MNPGLHREERPPLSSRAAGTFSAAGRRARGFTLLELCIVLMIMALLLGAIMPGMQSALSEQGLRSDSRELSLLVKTGMLRCDEENRSYVLELSETNLALHPVAPPAKADGGEPESNTADHPDDPNDPDAKPSDKEPDFHVSWPISPENELLVPDPIKPDKWDKVSPSRWVFRPGELCPASRIRLTRGKAEVEMSFNALTGNVEDERSFFP